MTSLPLIAVLFFAPQQVVTEKQIPVETAVQPTATAKPLPWPGPDVEPRNMGERENAHKLLDAKSIYIQTTLPPEESTPPVWLTQRWSVVGPDEADLRIFISKAPISVVVPDPNPSLTLLRTLAGDSRPLPIDRRPGIWYAMIVTDRDGKWVIGAGGLDDVANMWGNMGRQVLDQPQWEAKEHLRKQKEKEKQDKKKNRGKVAQQ